MDGKPRKVVIIPTREVTGEDTHSGYAEQGCHCAWAWLSQMWKPRKVGLPVGPDEKQETEV